MKSTVALLCLCLSALAWPGATEAAPPIADKPKRHSMPSIPKKTDGFDADPQKFQCLESCQRPILECMGRCSNEPTCPNQCEAIKLARCAETCGLVKPLE